jgi:hypothetical protein
MFALKKIKKYPLFQKIGELYERYERHISSAAFVVGFITDNLTLTRIDLLWDNLILVTYLTIAAMGIVLFNLYETSLFRGKIFERLHLWLPLAIQFVFGGLFSGFAVFYTRSASISASWPFLLVLLGLLVGNEFFREYYLGLGFQMSVFFIALFSYMIFYIPTLLGEMGARIFLLSGLVSLVVIGAMIYGLFCIIPKKIYQYRTGLFVGVSGIFLGVNILYFTNIIPPIPLSLKDAQVYHYVERTKDGNYLVRAEEGGWYDFLKIYDQIHLRDHEPAYVYSAVFAPAKLSANILHRWEYYDRELGKWVMTDRLRFSIFGGRDGGYRGYSMKANILPGLWRVEVITERGQLLGRVRFKVLKVAKRPSLYTSIR